ncbi:MAG: CpsD/CapB family tyrosine-protein kinase [Phycisphaerales bacterium]|nr:CpsD/CapB family tyrosine-protein kinase [Phycisphaerales bacterium]
MGRIAEALKRAEAERERLRGAQGGSTSLLDPPITPQHDRPKHNDDSGDDAEISVRSPIAADEGIHESIQPFYDRSSLISEQYRSLRTRLLTQNPQGEHRVLAVTSAIPREGKSVTTTNLGVILAEIRHFKVVLVDADFRRSRLGTLLDAKPGPGFADLLKGDARYEEVVRPTAIPNLYLVRAGETSGRSAAELLASQRAGAVIRRLQTDFHYTLIDTPPATTVTDVGIIGQMCNGVIMIVRINTTPEPLARRAVRLLKVNKVPILGCLLIGRADRGMASGYSYGYYYRYYHKDVSDSNR